MSFQPLHHTVVTTDVVGSSERDDQLQIKMRGDLYEILGRALKRQSLDIAALNPADLGDGFRLHAPATVSPLVMVSPFIEHLLAEVRLHRRSANETSRLRLRVAIHMGLLHREEQGGWAGRTLTECARLLDAPAARELIAEAPDADLVVVVSDAIYDAVVCQGYGPAPEDFQRIPVVVKESSFQAWAYVPRQHVSAPSSAMARGRDRDGSTAAGEAGGPTGAVPATPGVVLGSARAVIQNGVPGWSGTAGRRAGSRDD
ncbi:hypothetical protein [Micromonospora sp. NBC_01638]|uniref:hypothetical protein n=1 Tax=Micromonospora sp. NBC_01638 TaxID=2975982 RepID=UPI00386D11A5|nr:hypothetical protein OG811_13960 [Micromonospora sp. NBC_01638]